MKIKRLSDIGEEEVSHNPVIKKKVMLGPGDLPHLTNFSQAYFPPGEKAGAHSHPDMFEVFLIESGSGVIRVDGKELRMEKGTCISVHPGETHEIINTGPEDLIITFFGIKDIRRP